MALLCPDVALQPGPWSAGVPIAPASRCTPWARRPHAVGQAGETLSLSTVADWFNASAAPGFAPVVIGMPVLRGMNHIGREGFEDRDAAVLFRTMRSVRVLSQQP